MSCSRPTSPGSPIKGGVGSQTWSVELADNLHPPSGSSSAALSHLEWHVVISFGGVSNPGTGKSNALDRMSGSHRRAAYTPAKANKPAGITVWLPLPRLTCCLFHSVDDPQLMSCTPNYFSGLAPRELNLHSHCGNGFEKGSDEVKFSVWSEFDSSPTGREDPFTVGWGSADSISHQGPVHLLRPTLVHPSWMGRIQFIWTGTWRCLVKGSGHKIGLERIRCLGRTVLRYTISYPRKDTRRWCQTVSQGEQSANREVMLSCSYPLPFFLCFPGQELWLGQGRIKVFLILLAEISCSRTPVASLMQSASAHLKTPRVHCLVRLVFTLLEKLGVKREKGAAEISGNLRWFSSGSSTPSLRPGTQPRNKQCPALFTGS